MSDPRAGKLAEWFDAHGAAMVLYARQWLHDATVAEDVVQDVFVRLMGQDREPANVKAWLFVAVRNAAVDAARARRRRAAREEAVAAARRDDARPLLEVLAGDRVDAAAAEAALLELPPQQREVVVLRIWAGMTWAEVAAVTGAPLSTVYDQYRGALARVRRILDPTESLCANQSSKGTR